MTGGPRESKLTVAYRSLPSLRDLDFAVVRTLDVHEVLTFLAGPPLFSAGAHVENLYATAYRSSDGDRSWTFDFPGNATFSDGSPLTAEHWYHSVARTVRIGAGVHFNPKADLVGGDSSQDGYCEGLVLAGNTVQLRLREPNRLLPRLVGKIEATILPIERGKHFELDLQGQPSSGPYCLERHEGKRILLRINRSFPGHTGRAQFAEVELLQLSDEEALEARIRGTVDFISLGKVPSGTDRDRLLKSSQVQRDFGQTVFLSFRAAKISGRPTASGWMDAALRRRLAMLTRQAPPLDGFEKTAGLLMGNGLGRLTDAPAFKEGTNANGLPGISIAAVDRPISRHIVSAFESAGLNVKTTWVSHFNELFMGDAAETDAFIGWNDFCGEDPYVSLYNALNPQRPLFADDGGLRAELARIQQESESQAKDTSYRALHARILENAMVIPMFRYWIESYASSRLNLGPMKGGVLWTLGPSQAAV